MPALPGAASHTFAMNDVQILVLGEQAKSVP